MSSQSERFTVVFNGEIYNYQELKGRLLALGHHFHGRSDTEVMLAAFERWGVVEALSLFAGMFAFSVWDRDTQTLTLARDRLGKKPLYYSTSNDCLVFGSELKAIWRSPGFSATVDRGALSLYLRHNYVPGPRSIYEGVTKLPPSSWLSLRRTSNGRLDERKGSFWPEMQDGGRHLPRFRGSVTEAIAATDALVIDAVRSRLVSDVPLGAFLSGGIDSSLIVAIMQELSDRPVRTFTIGFAEDGFNEAGHASDVAKHLGTEHTELYLDGPQMLSAIPRLTTIYDEPFGDSSQLPTLLVSELARRSVTVALSGDGGDEVFCGYNRYLWFRKLWSVIRVLPAPARSALTATIQMLPASSWDSVLGGIVGAFMKSGRYPQLGDKLYKVSETLSATGAHDVYRRIVSHWKHPDEVVLGSPEPATLLNEPWDTHSLEEMTERMMYLDLVTYLPDDILVKVDRASMAVSLEARAPLLDHRLIELSATMPLSYKLRNGNSKWLLRQLLAKRVPTRLWDRPKTGFGVPLAAWLRGPLREWAEDLLSEQRLAREGYLRPGPIRERWMEHVSGRRDWHYLLWDVLMFQAWHQQWISGRSASR